MDLLKDVLISSNELKRYYDGVVPVDLWRAFNTKKDKELFDLVEKPFKMSNGRIRRADIEIIDGWVKVNKSPRGASTFDRSGVPKGKDWQYFKIPKGTSLPVGLAIVKDNYNTNFDATHYTIAPAYSMPLNSFKNLLTMLAKSATKAAA
jgi:hypothetical protein